MHQKELENIIYAYGNDLYSFNLLTETIISMGVMEFVAPIICYSEIDKKVSEHFRIYHDIVIMDKKCCHEAK